MIHMSLTCKEYQDNLKLSANNDEQAKKSMRTLEVYLYFLNCIQILVIF